VRACGAGARGLIEFGAGASEASLLTFEEVVDNDQRLR
jgi:hypothetical protein